MAQLVAGLVDLLGGLAEFLLTLGELRGALVDLHAEQALAHIALAAEITETADDAVQYLGDLHDFAIRLDLHRFLQAPRRHFLGQLRELGKASGNAPADQPHDQCGQQHQRQAQVEHVAQHRINGLQQCPAGNIQLQVTDDPLAVIRRRLRHRGVEVRRQQAAARRVHRGKHRAGQVKRLLLVAVGRPQAGAGRL